MPFALKRPLASNPKVKEWKYQDVNNDGYLEIVKYKTSRPECQTGYEFLQNDF